MPVKCDLNGWWPPGCGLVSQANDNALGAVTSLFANILENMASWLWAFITGAFTVSDVDDSQPCSGKVLGPWHGDQVDRAEFDRRTIATLRETM